MQIKEEPRSPSVDKYRSKDQRSHVRVKEEPDAPRKRKKRHQSRSPSKGGESSKKNKYQKQSHTIKRERKSNSRSKSRSPSRRNKSRNGRVERGRSLSEGEIEEPVSRWGPASSVSRNNEPDDHRNHRENNTNDQPKPQKPKEQPNLKLSGALAKETNMYRGVLINYSEPAEAKIPKKRWRFYPFKVFCTH